MNWKTRPKAFFIELDLLRSTDVDCCLPDMLLHWHVMIVLVSLGVAMLQAVQLVL